MELAAHLSHQRAKTERTHPHPAAAEEIAPGLEMIRKLGGMMRHDDQCSPGYPLGSSWGIVSPEPRGKVHKVHKVHKVSLGPHVLAAPKK